MKFVRVWTVVEFDVVDVVVVVVVVGGLVVVDVVVGSERGVVSFYCIGVVAVVDIWKVDVGDVDAFDVDFGVDVVVGDVGSCAVSLVRLCSGPN